MEKLPAPISNRSGNQQALGILGGLGPLASAEFLKTIYECNPGVSEQQSPIVSMYSDPTFPDRTETLLNGSSEILLDRLVAALERISSWGVTRIVICCVTIHYLLPELPGHLRQRVVSLLDTIFDHCSSLQKPQLLLCTNGSRQLNLFQRHEAWERVCPFIVLPDDADQQLVHDLIYRLKANYDPLAARPTIEALLARYSIESFIAGCTELHLLAKQFRPWQESESPFTCIDPLTIIAHELTRDSVGLTV
jgi:aspartate racemase